MKYKVIKSFLLLALVVFFIGCSSNSLSLSKDETLSIKVDKTKKVLSSTVLSHKYEFYRSLEINKYVLQDNNSVLFYESIDIEPDYMLSYTLLNTMKYIFDTKGFQIVAENKDITLAQLELHNNVFINIIFSFNYAQNFSYAYGFSNHEFMKIAKKIAENEDKVSRPARQAITLNENDMPLTRWSTQMLILQPLTSRYGRRGVF